MVLILPGLFTVLVRILPGLINCFHQVVKVKGLADETAAANKKLSSDLDAIKFENNQVVNFCLVDFCPVLGRKM
jgi:hypothetical protein